MRTPEGRSVTCDTRPWELLLFGTGIRDGLRVARGRTGQPYGHNRTCNVSDDVLNESIFAFDMELIWIGIRPYV